MSSSSSSLPFSALFKHPFSIAWRAALVKAPRLVPLAVLKYTTPEGPWPVEVEIPGRERGEGLDGRGKVKGSKPIGIRCLIWVPPMLSEMPEEKVLPVLVDFHGGGFVLGSCLEQAPFCSEMCRALGAVVISVDYRMGPIDRFPAAVWDAEDVVAAVLEAGSDGGRELRRRVWQSLEEDWRTKNGGKIERDRGEGQGVRNLLDTTRIAVSGFSSGGNLALNLGLDILESDLPGSNGWPCTFPSEYAHSIPLLLFYPSLDARQLPSQRTRPANLAASSPFWSEVDDILMPTYLPRAQAGHLRASPGLADIGRSLHPKAKILLVLPELDNLAEQSEIWVGVVKDAGREGDLEVLRYSGMKHGWTQFPEQWLGTEEKRTRKESFERAKAFVAELWGA